MVDLTRVWRSQRKALRTLGVSRSSWYYRTHSDKRRVATPKPQRERVQPAALSAEERQRAQVLVTQARERGVGIEQVMYEHLDRGEYVASARTLYRIAQTMNVKKERPEHTTRPAPVIVADKPNQAWSWDITDLHGEYLGQAFKAYVIVDIYSRRIVQWRVESREHASYTVRLFTTAFQQAIPQVVHADSGAVMRAQQVKQLFTEYGVIESHSRPRVSNDNPYSESLFSTMKTSSTYPGVFTSLQHAREWMSEWVQAYNTQHHHSGIAYYTPEQVYTNTWQAVYQQRQSTLAQHYQAHPNRYRKPPSVNQPPATSSINYHTHHTP